METKIQRITFIPDLVSLDIEERFLKYFYKYKILYPNINNNYKYLFKIKRADSLFIQKIINHNSYKVHTACFSEPQYFYFKKDLFLLSSLLIFDISNNTFYINENIIYTIIFSNILVGEYYSSFTLINLIIEIVLFINGYLYASGMSFKYEDKFYAFISPRNIGKSTFINNVITQKNYFYISDNTIIINFRENNIYPSAPSWSTKKTNSKTIFDYLIRNREKIIIKKSKLTKLFMINKGNENTSLNDFFYNSFLMFLSVSAIRDFIYLANYGDKLFLEINKTIRLLEKMKNKNKLDIKQINNYNFQKIYEK